MSLHSKETIYRKLEMRGKIVPGEYEMLIADYHERLLALEEKLNECKQCKADGVEEPAPARRSNSKVSKKKVSPS